MPNLSEEQFKRLAKMSNVAIEASLRRRLTDIERGNLYRMRSKMQLDRAAKKAAGPKSGRQRIAEMRAKDALVPYRDCADPERRARLEADPPAWLRYYLSETFFLPFGAPHYEIIKACQRSMASGTGMTVAAPRGFGKTRLEWGMALFGVLTGLCRFAVVIGWKRDAGAELLQQWETELSENERLQADYPCICDPFHESTASKRLQGLLRDVATEARCGGDIRKGRSMIILPDVREPTTGRVMPQAALVSASINGSIKGLNVGLLDGSNIRPDIALLDDPQDQDTAESAILTGKVVKRIDYSIRSLAGPKRRLTVMAAVTCVAIGDVSDILLARPGTEAIKVGQVVSWPDKWTDAKSPTRAAWDEWNRVRLEGLDAHDGGAAAIAYYTEHAKALTVGMAVSWKDRYAAGDSERLADPDAYYAAMWDYYELGEAAFMAERQNAPIKEGVTVFTLTPDLIVSRADPQRPPHTIPESWQMGAATTVAATDINHYGLHAGHVAYDRDQSGAVLWYANDDRITVPQNAPEQVRKQIIMKMLTNHAPIIAALRPVPALWIIDGGYEHEIVQRFVMGSPAARIPGCQTVIARGYPGQYYKPYKSRIAGRTVIDGGAIVAHWTKWPMGFGIAFNSHYWHEISQRAWLGDIGSPGACSLPSGSHRDFAEQNCRDHLVEKLPGRDGMIWNYHKAPGRNDYGDVMAMCYMGAAWGGIGTGGMVTRAKTRPRRGLSVRHVNV